MEITSKKDIIGIIFLALSVIMLGYMFITPLNHYIMHIDEYFTMSITTLPLGDIVNVASWYVHPPLYYILGKVAVTIGAAIGMDSLHSLRILSIIPYIIILVISATKIRKEYGLLSAGLFAFSLAVMSEFFAHFLIASMYSWAVLFLLIVFISFTEIIKTNDKKAWIILTVFTILCIYTHYFAAISAACIYLILLAYIMKFEKDELERWAMSIGAALILFIPWTLPLINQMSQAHAISGIAQINLNTFINALGYIAYANDVIIGLIATVVLIAFLYIYIKDSKGSDEKERFIALSGAGVYLGTIILSILISVVFKSVFMLKYLLPATAVMWLAISIVLGRIKNRKMFMISAALIAVLLIVGIATTFATNDEMYKNGVQQKQILDNITNNPNSMLIIPSQNIIMYFLDYADHSDIYFINVDHVFGENMDRLHKLYDFNTFNGNDIDKVIANNTQKNIYIISWGDPVLNTSTEKLDTQAGIVFSKVKSTNTTTIPEEETYYEE